MPPARPAAPIRRPRPCRAPAAAPPAARRSPPGGGAPPPCGCARPPGRRRRSAPRCPAGTSAAARARPSSPATRRARPRLRPAPPAPRRAPPRRRCRSFSRSARATSAWPRERGRGVLLLLGPVVDARGALDHLLHAAELREQRLGRRGVARVEEQVDSRRPPCRRGRAGRRPGRRCARPPPPPRPMRRPAPGSGSRAPRRRRSRCCATMSSSVRRSASARVTATFVSSWAMSAVICCTAAAPAAVFAFAACSSSHVGYVAACAPAGAATAPTTARVAIERPDHEVPRAAAHGSRRFGAGCARRAARRVRRSSCGLGRSACGVWCGPWFPVHAGSAPRAPRSRAGSGSPHDRRGAARDSGHFGRVWRMPQIAAARGIRRPRFAIARDGTYAWLSAVMPRQDHPAPSFSGLGHRPFTAAARVRIPLGSPRRSSTIE